MSVFIRRFLSDPGNEVFLEIEAVNILDLEPPASISGIGTGTIIAVGEYENGDFNSIIEPTGTSDFVNTLGSLGYNYGGVPGNNPCARARKADGALNEETWNGNAFVQLNGKKFKRLLCVRVDTSVGNVTLNRQAFITGSAAFAYNLEPSQILSLDIGAGPVSATFTATAATVTSGAGTYPTTFAGGETLTLGYDGGANFTVTFLAADQSEAQVISRINTYAGFTFAAAVSGTTFSLTGIQRGNGAQVRVVSASAGVLTKLGLTAATTSGTGNVSNIDAVTFAEIKTIVEAGVSGTYVEQDQSGNLRISKVYVTATDYIQVGSATTATGLGFAVALQGSNDGFANFRSDTQFSGSLAVTGTVTFGVDLEANFNVTFTSGMTQAQTITAINTAAGYTMATSLDSTHTLLRGRANAGQVRVVAGGVAILTSMGFAVSTVSSTGVTAGTFPAGSQVQNTAGTRVFVTMQDVDITVAATNGVGGAGPYVVKIRHAFDDGTGLSATAGTLTQLASAPVLSSFQVYNASLVNAALTEAAIDAAYSDAIDATIDMSTAAKEANVIFAARQSNVIRRKLKENALDASANGMFGRMAIIRPPLGTAKSAALSKVAEPGVGAYRDQRVIYCFPGANTFVPIIGRRGLAGGKGFTSSGNVDVGADGFMASILSQLPPEENPGQLTPFLAGVNSLETSANAQGYTIVDYTLFRGNGIAALRMDDGNAIFQSGVTSVDPGTYPNLRNIARRRMADFIQDTLARRLKAFGKKLSTNARRKAITSEIRNFMNGLVSKNNPAFQRISAFSIDDSAGNTPDTLAQGIFRIILKTRTLASLDAIVLETTIGESVQIDEVQQAA